MNLIKEWYSRGGVSARFYFSNGMYFIDFNGCRDTVQVFVNMTGRNLNIANAVIHDNRVPKTYRRYVKDWVNHNLSAKMRRAR